LICAYLLTFFLAYLANLLTFYLALRSGSAHWDLGLAVEVRQFPLRSGAGEKEAEAEEKEKMEEKKAGEYLL
jgi:hypothetical protein